MLRKVIIILVVLGLIALGLLYYFKSSLFDPNVKKDDYELFIPTGSSFDDVLTKLENDGVLKNVKSFVLVSKLMKYQKETVPSGRYLLSKGMSNRSLVGKLRSGNQDAVSVTFNNLRTIAELSGAIASNLEIDSNEIYNVIMSPDFLDKQGLNANNVMTLFIPNTYQVYWDVKADKVVSRLVMEYNKFWESKDRMTKLKDLGMTKQEVYTLASIVEKESNLKSERPTLAAVYLNRIEQGIMLQADPTVVFATGDFELRRVLNKHLEMDSPYNTYMNLGLPPGPIYMPSINSIDAVLANEKHEYIFFCAKPGYNSGHLFAKTNAQHEANARKYHKWLSSQNIR